MLSQGHPYGFPVGVTPVLKEQRTGSLLEKKIPVRGRVLETAHQPPTPPSRYNSG
jgi:hypothetical protein